MYQNQLSRKGIPSSLIQNLLERDEQKRILSSERDDLKAQQNTASKKIPTLTGAEKEKVLKKMKFVSEELKKTEAELQKVSEKWNEIMISLPNPPLDEVPDGGEDDFKTISEWGEKPKFSFDPKEHWEICEKLGILDTERSAKVSGARFYYLKNELAILQMALMNWAFLEIQKLGFSPMIPPFMVRENAMYGTGFFPADKNEVYRVNPGEDDLFLIGTSEVPLTAYYGNEILDEKDLPQKFAGYSPCFRREAGTYGKDTKGILRVHQFEKIEMVTFCSPDESAQMHETMREAEEKLLQALKIPYRVILVAAGDLGGSAVKKYDIEAWLPGQNKYREMTSTSNCTDFQARRLNIRVRKENGEVVIAHTLNGTAVSSRPLIAILENFQNEDGSVDIPEVLWPFCGGFQKITIK